LTFTFDLTLKGGEYQCKSFAAATTTDPSASSSYVTFNFLDTNSNGHWVSDFMPFVMKDNSLQTSQYIGGNPFGADIGYEQIAAYDSSFLAYRSTCVDFDKETELIDAGFNQFCIHNSCGSVNTFCSSSANFKGEISFDKFETSTAVEVDTINPSCAL